MTKRYVDTSSELAYLRADLLRPVQFGAMVTLKIAARAPEAGRAIVLEDPPLFIHQAPARRQSAAHRICRLARFGTDGVQPEKIATGPGRDKPGG